MTEEEEEEYTIQGKKKCTGTHFVISGVGPRLEIIKENEKKNETEGGIR